MLATSAGLVLPQLSSAGTFIHYVKEKKRRERKLKKGRRRRRAFITSLGEGGLSVGCLEVGLCMPLTWTFGAGCCEGLYSVMISVH